MDASVNAHIVEAADGIRQNYDIFWREQTMVESIHFRLLDRDEFTRDDLVLA